MTLPVLRITELVFCTMALSLGLSGVFLMVRLSYGVEEENHTGKVPFLSHHIKGAYCQHHLLLLITRCGVGSV